MPILGIISSSTRQGLVTDTGAMFPIAMANVGSATAPYIEFTNIPQTYKHLQIRAIHTLSGGANNLYMNLNTSTSSTYYHYLFGDGSSATAGSTTGNIYTIQWGNAATTMNVSVVDILDYTSSKNKVIRTLGGVDYNGSGGVYLGSNLYSTSSAISSIRIGANTYNLGQYSQFALYGIK